MTCCVAASMGSIDVVALGGLDGTFTSTAGHVTLPTYDQGTVQTVTVGGSVSVSASDTSSLKPVFACTRSTVTPG